MVAPDGFPFDPPDGPFGPGGLSARAGGAAAPSCAVPCFPDFHDAVLRLAARRGCDAGALAAAALLVTPDIAGIDDPGAPADGEATAVLAVLAEHPAEPAVIRRALAAALALADPQAWRLVRGADLSRLEAQVQVLDYRNKALVNALERVSFQPLDGGLTQVRDAARLFGFVNEWCFDEDRVVRRFRELAPVYHPDTGVVGCRDRMVQLIEARNLLIRHVRTAYTSGAWARRSGSNA
ncbi:hypothetical protein [Azospirillum halopraeferens]|uniref:hypothetical protein n=1 Tax=Azospirillum halopraeferens TaxID=34010 RepID=UPI00041B126D|nr:hypothetical protein [Azospirillum halopraeferens]